MTERVFPHPNLGQGDQWAREIEKAIRDLGDKQGTHSQLIDNLNRGSAASSMNSAKVYRSIETLETGSGSTTEFSNDLANRITLLESSVATLRDAQTPPRAISAYKSGTAVPAGAMTPIGTLTVEVPENANFALVLISGYYVTAASTTSNSAYGAININGETINDSIIAIRSGTEKLEDYPVWAAPVQLLEDQSQLVLSIVLYSSQATTAASRISAMVIFQS